MDLLVEVSQSGTEFVCGTARGGRSRAVACGPCRAVYGCPYKLLAAPYGLVYLEDGAGSWATRRWTSRASMPGRGEPGRGRRQRREAAGGHGCRQGRGRRGNRLLQDAGQPDAAFHGNGIYETIAEYRLVPLCERLRDIRHGTLGTAGRSIRGGATFREEDSGNSESCRRKHLQLQKRAARRGSRK